MLIQGGWLGLRGQAGLEVAPSGAQPESPRSSHEMRVQPPASSPNHDRVSQGVPQADSPALLESAALDCQKRGDFAGAIQAYRQALTLDPNNSDLKLGLARALSLGGRSEESKGVYHELLSKAPQNADALEGLGLAFLRSDHLQEARGVFERLSALHPVNAEFKIDLARVEARQGSYKEAQEILTAVLIFHPRLREARLQLAYVKLYQGKYAAALAGFGQVLKTDPTDFEALLGNARVFYFRGDIPYSFSLASKLLEEHPNDFDAVFLLANLERARHRTQQSLELLARAEQLSPANPECLALEKAIRRDQSVGFHASASYAREASAGNGSLDLVGFAGQDLRRFGYDSTVDFTALPRSKSSVSFDSMPASSPGANGGVVVPSQVVYRQTTPVLSNLTLRGGVGLVRFGPGGLEENPNQSQSVAVAAYRPLGLVTATYALRSNLDLDFTIAREAVPYTPLAARLGVMDTRVEGGVKYTFAPHTELQADLYTARYSSIPLQQLGLVNGAPSLVAGAPLREPARGGSVILMRNVLRFERASLDLGYQGRVYAFDGSQQKDYMGFFNPTFYQVHQLAARASGTLRGPFGFDFSGGLGVQQVDSHQPYTQALDLNPALSFRINSRTSLKLGYLHYNYAQSLGVIRGNGVTLSTDSHF